MHEQGIAQQMIKVALQYASDHHVQHIIKFQIEMNQAADENEESLRFYLENLTRNTPAQDATFVIERVSARAHCQECGNTFDQEFMGETCPQCFSTRVIPEHPQEFKLASIDVE
jgi:hydrogenase nickel incorporation protein HypA/HybF